MADKITPKDLAEKIGEFVLIDVREADDEVEEDGTIEGAINIPLGQLIRKSQTGCFRRFERKMVCTYCNGGYRGNIEADELGKKGFKVVTMEGGYEAWNKRKEQFGSKKAYFTIVNSYSYISGKSQTS